MKKYTCIFVLMLVNVVRTLAEEDPIVEPKISVNPITNNINTNHNSYIKPTTEQVEFEPGVPPGWSQTPSKTTTKRPRRTHKTTSFPLGPSKLPIYSEPGSEEEIVTEKKPTGQANPTSTTYPPGVSPPEPVIIDSSGTGGVVDWVLNALGFKPSDKPIDGSSNVGVVTGNVKCPKCACGLTYKHNRIVGGVETQVNEYPWMVVLLNGGRFYCGGSAINNKYVLTAGHCVNGISKDRLLAVFLDHDRSTSQETSTFFRRISRIINHGAYGVGASYNNDIALLQLEQPLNFDGILKPVCLPLAGKSYSGQIGIVTGWGATASQGSVSNKLQEVRVPILSHDDCQRTGYGKRVTENMICAGYPQGMKDSCQGDSGGPMHVVNGTNHFIVGIVSWGEGCARPNYPGVYTRVNRYLTWILGNTKDSCFCF
ncbi:hypothetical protein RI129_001408 [Pyrocoelia pectoralis]|uniref:Peptidase S1 domain-containing protein n=1 Tax=Pyrocoelia pectoralis TaxID=417401 RepID=A0AAN7VU85_9COLE